jgi:fructose/tagatose bisphosphate aldolase
MSKQRINVTLHGLSSSDKQKEREIKKAINAKINKLNLAYNKCGCTTCRITILNQLEDIVNAEIYKWYDAMVIPDNQEDKMEMDALDNAIDHIAVLNELIVKFNNLRKELLNS